MIKVKKYDFISRGVRTYATKILLYKFALHYIKRITLIQVVDIFLFISIYAMVHDKSSERGKN